MAYDLKDLAFNNTATTGTGTITLGSAVTGWLSIASLLSNGDTTDIVIIDGTNREVAKGCVYSSSGTTLTRGTLVASTTGSALNLSGSATVGISMRSEIAKAAYDRLLNVSANKLIGAATAGAAVEIDCTAAGRAILDDADATAQRATLGLAAGAVAAEASQAEMESPTGSTQLVTPRRLNNHPGTAKGWIYFNGTGTIAINASHNVTSITDNGSGDYTVTWDTDFSSANYCVVSHAGRDTTYGVSVACGQQTATGLAAGSYRFRTARGTGIAGVPMAYDDVADIFIAAFGDQ